MWSNRKIAGRPSATPADGETPSHLAAFSARGIAIREPECGTAAHATATRRSPKPAVEEPATLRLAGCRRPSGPGPFRRPGRGTRRSRPRSGRKKQSGRSAVSTSPTPFGCMICATPGRHSPCGPGTRTGGRWSSRCYRREPPRRRRRLARTDHDRGRVVSANGLVQVGELVSALEGACRDELQDRTGPVSGARDACRQRPDDNRAGRVDGSWWRSVADKPAEPVATLVRHEPVGRGHTTTAEEPRWLRPSRTGTRRPSPLRGC